MLGELFRFEVGYRLKQPSTWVYALVLIALPFLLMHVIDGSSKFLNAPEALMNAAGIMGGVGMLISAGVFGDAAARDVSSRMHALFYTSPLRESEYVLGRFLGALCVNAVLLLGIPLGLLLASVMPYMDAGMFGPVQLTAYVQMYLLVLLPNLLLGGACMFAAAMLTRRALATYVGGIVLFVLGIIAADVTDGFANRTLSAMVDPFGTAAIRTVTRYWTPVERNARLIGWPGIVLWNRALWLAVASGLLAFVAARFRFVHPVRVAPSRWWNRIGRRGVVVDTAPVRVTTTTSAPVPGAGRSFTFKARVRQTIAVAMRAWREIAATRAFLLILFGALVFVFAAGWDIGAEVFGTSTWPVTHLIAGSVLSTVLAPVMAVLIAIFAGELVWREREAGMGDIAGIAPIPNGVALLGRFLAFVAMLALLQAVLVGAGMTLQALRGYHRYEPMVYLKLLFGVKLVDYVLLAVLAMTIHVIVNSKFVGHLVVVLYFASIMMPGFVGLQHPMLIYGGDPGWVWSDMNGLSPFLEGLVWFRLYWAAWALLLAVVASLFWVRGRESGVARRISLARQRLRGPVLKTAALAAVLILSLGGFVFYNTNILNHYEQPKVRMAERAAYERRYKRFEHAPRPDLAHAQLKIDLFPRERAAEVRGTFQFVNRTARAVDSLHVLLSPAVDTRSLDFDRDARIVVNDSALFYRIYALAQPIAPGDSIAMTFDVAYRPRGFRSNGAPTDVTSNGGYLDRSWYPSIGYQTGRELSGEQERREQQLPPRTPMPSAGDVDTRDGDVRGIQLVDAQTIIGTDSGQTAVTSGTLVREWRENGRHYFEYRDDAPTRFGGAVMSAAYAVRDSMWKEIPLRVYHHPTHEVNVDRMLHSMAASLAYYSEQFGPYQFHELRVVEFPRYSSFARAHPHTIAFSEGSAFLSRIDSGDIDRTFFVVAHETAHQWWGGQVIPAAGVGASMVSETLAQFSSMMVFEQEYGLDLTRRFYDYNMNQYLTGRTVFTNREAPLLDVERQNYVYYFKGAVAMYTLRERLGADVVNGALRRFRDQYAGTDAPPATSRALYGELKAVTPDSLKPLLSDLFEHITLWDVRTDSVRAEPDGKGAWRVTLHVDASKVRADSIGRQTPIAMDDLVEIGAFAPADAGSGGLGKTIYLTQHRVQSGKQTITIIVPKRPAHAGIDPYARFIQRDRDDNVKAVEDTPPR